MKATLRRLFLARWGVFWTSRLAAAVFISIGYGLLFQQTRYERTPAYGNLLTLLPARVWGVIYMLSALGLLIWVALPKRTEQADRLAHFLPNALIFFWFAAFIVRYATDKSTTNVNPTSWFTYACLLLHSQLVETEPQVKIIHCDVCGSDLAVTEG